MKSGRAWISGRNAVRKALSVVAVSPRCGSAAFDLVRNGIG